jgi:hypothetical protein
MIAKRLRAKPFGLMSFRRNLFSIQHSAKFEKDASMTFSFYFCKPE